MKHLGLVFILLGFLAGTANAAAPESKLVDLTFLRRLQADQVPFTTQPLASIEPSIAAATYPEITYQPYMQAAGEEILGILLAHHPGPKPDHIAFLVTAARGFNCTTLMTGEIVCTYAVMEMLLPTPEGRNQLTFLLAHELGHRLIAGHGARFAKSDKIKADWAKTGLLVGAALDIALSKKSQSGNTITITATPAATSALWNTYFGGIYAGEGISGLASLAWSQAEEDEADQFGVFLMQRAGLDLSAAPQMFSALQTAVHDNQLQHASTAQLVATKAADAAILEALVNGKGWLNILTSAVMGGFSAMDEVSKDHYHRDFGDRAKRCDVIVNAIQPPDADTARQLVFASYLQHVDEAAPAAAVTIMAAAESVAAAPHQRAAPPKRGSRSKPGTLLAKAAPPPSNWELAGKALPQLQEIRLSDEVMRTLAKKGVKDALALCPPRAQTSQLALRCGLALAGDGQKDSANTLFAQVIQDRYANPEMFRTVALTQAQMKDPSDALKTLDVADQRFADGEFFPDRISLLLKGGDKDGAKVAADRCQASSAAPAETKKLCVVLMSQNKT